MDAPKLPQQTWAEHFASLPYENEELSPEEIESLRISQEEGRQGKVVSHEEILREFGLLK